MWQVARVRRVQRCGENNRGGISEFCRLARCVGVAFGGSLYSGIGAPLRGSCCLCGVGKVVLSQCIQIS